MAKGRKSKSKSASTTETLSEAEFHRRIVASLSFIQSEIEIVREALEWKARLDDGAALRVPRVGPRLVGLGCFPGIDEYKKPGTPVEGPNVRSGESGKPGK